MIQTQADAENDNELMGREDFLEGFVMVVGVIGAAVRAGDQTLGPTIDAPA